ncbi:T9SS type A sorting domain-containing protein [Flavobacterium buctense]|uniref:T9SS type A sorting domain-containing protein n=1 Tax=Flavobacterium buctense TaxID=1648146 RepID=A0ABU9DZX0_9FLAO|nr:T9SS type A sorting domain-containing protein [Flavobacterium buctense]
MKKLYFNLLLALLSLTANAQVITIPDANFKAKLLSASPSNQIAKNLAGAYFKIDANDNGQIEVAEALNVSVLDVNNNNVPASTGLLIADLTGIEYFNNLTILNCAYNSISTLNVSYFPNLTRLFCQVNQLSILDFTGLTQMLSITCFQNQITVLDVEGLVNLTNVSCESNNLTTLDFSTCISLNYMTAGSNELETLFIKNGKNEASLGIGGNPNLTYICADEGQFTNVQNLLDVFGMTTNLNSYCTFTPGGTYYTVNGVSKMDTDNNGCDSNDPGYSYMRFNVTNGTSFFSLFANQTGAFSIPVVAGNYTITPQIENTPYFILSPTSFNVSFPTQANPFTQNFCVTPLGVHQDLEITIVPLIPARPGFDATYRVIYRNKGNVTLSGSVTFAYEDSKMDLVSVTPIPTSQSLGFMSWNYTDLLPFERRDFMITMNINSPTETPAIAIGDQLNFAAVIYPIQDDGYPLDNESGLKQVVVGSYDPNDKTCVEGTSITPNMVGQYVNYVIRFENTGTFAAENVVIKDIIDVTKFDLTSLVPLYGSHPFVTRVINTNQLEFIFENINLPFDDANNGGYVVFKIKTKPTLVVGNTFANSADIYFDYNFPIVTDTYTTTVQALDNQDFEFNSVFSLSPVPTKDLLTITAKESVVMSSVNIYNTLGQLIQVNANPSETIDVSGLQAGSYFIKIISDRGSSTGKFIKE